MAIVQLKPDSQQLPPVTTIPQALQPSPTSLFTPLSPESSVNSLLKYVEGYPWTVHFYGQITGEANTLEHVDPGSPNFTSPYYEVKGMILQVSSPLTSSYDQASAVTMVSGSAILPYRITPNVGDLFLAQVDTGEDAVFIITSVSRKSHRKDTLYEVDYTLYQYASADTSLMAKVVARVQHTYHFNKDSDFFNRDVLLAPSAHEAQRLLRSILTSSRQLYFERFAQHDAKALFIPGQEGAMYDPHLVSFLMRTVPHDSMVGLPVFSFSMSDAYSEQPSFWDMLLARSPHRVSTICKQYAFAPASALKNMARYGTLKHAGVRHVLYPLDPDTTLYINQYKNTTAENSDMHFGVKTDRNYSSSTLTVKTQSHAGEEVKHLLPELFEDNYYVVSGGFYDYLKDSAHYSEVSFVELLVARFLQGKAIAKEDLVLALQSYEEWSALHQLYWLPVLWVLAHAQGGS